MSQELRDIGLGHEHIDLLGVAIIGIVMGMGGGIIRDMLLDQPLSTLQSNWYLLTATGAALVGMLLAAPLRRLNGIIVGTLSSVFVAAPVLLWISRRWGNASARLVPAREGIVLENAQ